MFVGSLLFACISNASLIASCSVFRLRNNGLKDNTSVHFVFVLHYVLLLMNLNSGFTDYRKNVASSTWDMLRCSLWKQSILEKVVRK